MPAGVNWMDIALILAGIALAIVAIVWIGTPLWPEQAQKAKSWLPYILGGLALLAALSALAGALGG